MRRILPVAFVLLLLFACGGLIWGAREASVAQFILPDAKDIDIRQTSATSMSISYHAGTEPYEWRARVARELDQRGWRSRWYTFNGTSAPFTVIWYRRELRIGPLRLVENAILGGDLIDQTSARIRLRNEIHLFD